MLHRCPNHRRDVTEASLGSIGRDRGRGGSRKRDEARVSKKGRERWRERGGGREREEE